MGQLDRRFDILLIDDSPSDARLVREALGGTEARSRLSVASNGVEGVAFLRRQGKYVGAPRPDLILLDLNLPKKNGAEVLQEIKADEALMHIPVVVLSSSASHEDVQRAYGLHANCYVTKPGDLDCFIQVIRTIEEFWLTTAQLLSD